MRTAERINERTAALCGASSSIRRINTSNSRSRGGSSAMSASSPASTARSICFTKAARIAKVEPNAPRSSESETPAPLAISAKPICSIDFSASSAMKASMMRSRSDRSSLAARRVAGFDFDLRAITELPGSSASH